MNYKKYLNESKKVDFKDQKEWKDYLKSLFGKDILFMSTIDGKPIHIAAFEAKNGDFFKKGRDIGYWAGSGNKLTYAVEK